MRTLILGSGGRETAMAMAMATAPGTEVLCAPGNPGTAAIGRNVMIAPDDLRSIVQLVRTESVDLVVPGPESFLCAGLADVLCEAPRVLCCGPRQAAARLESSKVYTRLLTAPLGVPGPMFRIVRGPDEIDSALAAFAQPPVVKADGLCAGKGVYLPDSFAGCAAQAARLLEGSLGNAGRTVLLEERLTGSEASLFFACHGEDCLALPHARDYKRLCDGDLGPNTGGMGAVSPNPLVTTTLVSQVAAEIVQPTLSELVRRGTPFVGFLFVGLMLTARGPQLLEFNVRLGDPEAQAILPRLREGEFLRLCVATALGRFAGLRLAVDPRPACAVVLTSRGYPAEFARGAAVEIDPAVDAPGRRFLPAGMMYLGGVPRVSGGRVGTVVALASTSDAARAHAYDGIRYVRFPGMHYRRDIGAM
jgi:phosphoribosylamine--glycine ligase